MDNEHDLGQVGAMCLTCGGTYYEIVEGTEGDIKFVKCARCGRSLTRQELLEGSLESSEALAIEGAEELLKQQVKDMRRELKRAFRGNKHVRFE